MPVFIWQKSAFGKFIEVESRGDKEEAKKIIRHQRQSDLGDRSFWAFYQQWQEMYALNPEIVRHQPRFELNVNNNGAIYGDGGWNRYTVRNTGEIMFVEAFTLPRRDIELAKKIGFRIF